MSLTQGTYVTIGGKRYLADEQTLADMAKDGVKYTVDESPYAKQASVDETAGDALRGAAHGATLGLADAKLPGVDKSLPELVGLDPYDKVKERSPVASMAGDLTGAAVNPAAEIGKLGQGAGVLARMGREALSGAAQGGVRALAEGDDVGTASAIGGGLGGLVGGGAAKLGEWGGQAVNAIGSKLGESADAMRSRSVGVLSKEAKALADRLGVSQLPSEIAALVERVSPSGWSGKSAAQRTEELGSELKNTYGPKIDQILQDAGTNEGLDAFVPQSWKGVLAKLQGEGASAPRATPAERAYGANLAQNAEELAQEAGPADLVGLRGQKTRFQKDAHTGSGGSIPDAAAKQASGRMGETLHAELDDIMSHALPETEQAFHQANRDFGERALIRKMAKGRAAVESTDSMFPALVTAATGGVIGGATSDDPIKGAALGAIAGGITGTRSQLLQQASKSRGLDALANLARGLERQAPAAAQGVRNAGEGLAGRSRVIGAELADLLTDDEENR